ncbi:hypothetical protein NPIL_634791 [Nephila pilipes]|uniref:Uncharacterized protein n=1 Tax=Nephila pilipes TaxID=299642 RepID=A0A8X6NZC3_NEPPI|nr:hypothetical protein NPIL_649871 [Nephila pilipes]GFT40103.1 hypothetical protein NPIL_128371 [Nephila pilipes]GFT67100.1 hypothetical protein NPIL_67741 [Nephila pilipes]GFT92754.1 hypothetical protein NPIL_634791 [Nephila pilipes]
MGSAKSLYNIETDSAKLNLLCVLLQTKVYGLFFFYGMPCTWTCSKDSFFLNLKDIYKPSFSNWGSSAPLASGCPMNFKSIPSSTMDRSHGKSRPQSALLANEVSCSCTV